MDAPDRPQRDPHPERDRLNVTVRVEFKRRGIRATDGGVTWSSVTLPDVSAFAFERRSPSTGTGRSA